MNVLKKMNANENFITMINKENRHLYLCYQAHFQNKNLTYSINVLKKESVLQTTHSAMEYFNKKVPWKVVKLCVFETESDMHGMKKPLLEMEVNYKEPSPQKITEKISLISFDTVQNLEKQLTAFIDTLLPKKEAQ